MTDDQHRWNAAEPAGDTRRLAAVPLMSDLPGSDRAPLHSPIGNGGAGSLLAGTGTGDAAPAAYGSPAAGAPEVPRYIRRRLWRVKVTDPNGVVVFTPPVPFSGPPPSWAVSAEYGWVVELQFTQERIERDDWLPAEHWDRLT